LFNLLVPNSGQKETDPEDAGYGVGNQQPMYLWWNFLRRGPGNLAVSSQKARKLMDVKRSNKCFNS